MADHHRGWVRYRRRTAARKLPSASPDTRSWPPAPDPPTRCVPEYLPRRAAIPTEPVDRHPISRSNHPFRQQRSPAARYRPKARTRVRRLHPPVVLSPGVSRPHTPQHTVNPAVGAPSYRRRHVITGSSQALASIRSPTGRETGVAPMIRADVRSVASAPPVRLACVARRMPGYRKQ
jgi:hypothetical protein